MRSAADLPDAQRPIGRFIADRVLPRWEQLNEYPRATSHQAFVTKQLQRRGFTVLTLPGVGQVYLRAKEVRGGGYGRLTTLVSAQALEATSSWDLLQEYLAAAEVPAYEAAAGADAPHNEGLAVRFFTVGTEPTAAAVQVPLFVVGDGRSTVRELVTRSFEHRRRNRALALALPREVTPALITAADLTLDTVLGHKELRILRRNSDLFTGMLPVDVTAVISAELTEVARQAAASVPGYGSGSVDILTSSLRSAADAAVFGMDPAASMRMHAYPALGSRQGIGRHISEQFRLRSEYWDQSFSPALLEWDELE